MAKKSQKLKKIDGFCAPLALQYISGADDKTVYEVCSFNGFTQQFGMEEHEFLESASELGVRYRRVNLKNKGLYRGELSEFIKFHLFGTYLIYTSGHLFVVSDGQIVDPLSFGNPGLARLVTGAWKVFK